MDMRAARHLAAGAFSDFALLDRGFCLLARRVIKSFLYVDQDNEHRLYR